MDYNRLTKQIIEFYKNRSKAQVDTIKWIEEVKNDLRLAGITQEDFLDRDIFRKKSVNGKLTRRTNQRRKLEAHGQTKEKQLTAKEWKIYGLKGKHSDVD